MLACWLGVTSVLIWVCVGLALLIILYTLVQAFSHPKPPPLPRGGLRALNEDIPSGPMHYKYTMPNRKAA